MPQLFATQEVADKVHAWLAERGFSCLCCGGTRFAIGNPCHHTSYQPEDMSTGYGPKLVPVYCSECGHTSFFAAGAIGLAPKEGERH
jgi:predicted nucleic-acid-binding Zn-ribbon protein